jgi:hypothetical protein
MIMWTEILKAKFLPEKDPQKWLRILESRESVEEFVEELRGKFESRGINNTIDFLHGGETSEGRISSAITDEDEDEVKDNYVGFRPIMIELLEERLDKGRKREHAAELGTGVAQTRKLRTEEQFISTLKEMVSDPTPENKQLAETFLEEHSDWLNRKTEGQSNRSRMRNKFGYELTGADFSTKVYDPATTSRERRETQYKNLYRLFKVPEKSTVTSKKEYKMNEITPHLAAEFYSIVKNAKEIPKGLKPNESTIYKDNRVNPYVRTLLENEKPFDKLTTEVTAENRARKVLRRTYDDERLDVNEDTELDREYAKIAGKLQPRDVIVELDFIHSLPTDEIKEGTLEEQQRLYHELPETGAFTLGNLELYSFGGPAGTKRKLEELWNLALKEHPHLWGIDEDLTEEDAEALKNLTIGTKPYEGVLALIKDNPNIFPINTPELEHQFTGKPLDLLVVIVELDAALNITGEDLEDMEDVNEFANAVEERIPLIRDRLVELTKEKVEEIITNQREYMLMPARRKATEERAATDIFTLMIRKGIINKVN